MNEIGVSYEDLLSGNIENPEKIYSCIIWIEDIDMTEAVEAGIDAAEITRDTYSPITTYVYPYTVTEVDETTFIDVDLDENESDEYVQTYIENERAMAAELYAEKNTSFVQKTCKK